MNQNPGERILTSDCTHYVLVDTSTSNPEEQAKILRNVRFSFEEGLLAERKQQTKSKENIPVLNIFAASQYEDALNMMHKLRKNEHVLLLENFPGYGKEIGNFLKNPVNVDINSGEAGLWTQISTLQDSSQLHLIDLSVCGSFQRVFEIASKILPIAKQIKLG